MASPTRNFPNFGGGSTRASAFGVVAAHQQFRQPAAKPQSTPTHIAFAKDPGPVTGPGGYSPLGSQAAPRANQARPGALYGALDSLQAATEQLRRDLEDTA